MARRGATTRDPKLRQLPAKNKAGEVAAGMDQSGMAGQVAGGGDIKQGGTKSQEEILKAANRAANRAPVERLSPGVYRSAGGGLVTQQGRSIQRQPRQGMAQQVAGGMQQNPWQGVSDNNMAGQVADMVNRQGTLINQYDDKMYRYPLGTNMQDEMRRIAEGAGNVAQQPNNQIQQGIYYAPGFGPNAQRAPQMPQMPQASANQGGQYRLSPGVYGTREQAMQQYNQQMQQMYQSAIPGAANATGQMPDFSRFGPMMPQVRKG